MIQIIYAKYLYTPNGFKENYAMAFDKTILAIDTLTKLKDKFPNAKIIKTPPNSIIYPGFINSHIHLEFSKNKTTLVYGDFIKWLYSVIEYRDDLLKDCNDDIMLEACNEMLNSGVTTFGAISSFATELEVCKKTPQKVIFFNELIGSNASYADMLYNDFLERFALSKNSKKEDKITPAIAIHSPYSVHPIILKKAINLAKEQNVPLTSHFLESYAEKEWLEKGEGDFKEFFLKYFNTKTPVTSKDEFLNSFKGYPTLFTHCTEASKNEFEEFKKEGHTPIHCPRSNRLLGCKRLEIEELKTPFNLATDGLSSNNSLSIFDELRSALMLHNKEPIEKLALKLIESITINPAKSLNLNCGSLEIGKESDFVTIELPETPQKEQIALQTILQTKKVSTLYIDGEKVL